MGPFVGGIALPDAKTRVRTLVTPKKGDPTTCRHPPSHESHPMTATQHPVGLPTPLPSRPATGKTATGKTGDQKPPSPSAAATTTPPKPAITKPEPSTSDPDPQAETPAPPQHAARTENPNPDYTPNPEPSTPELAPNPNPPPGGDTGEPFLDDGHIITLNGASPSTFVDTRKPRAKKRGHYLTPRDLDMLRHLARYGVATNRQLAAFMKSREDSIRSRLPRMRKSGLIISSPGPTGLAVWRATDEGISLSGTGLTAIPAVKWSQLTHSLALTSIGVHFESIGETVITEREIRALDTRSHTADTDMSQEKKQRTRVIPTNPRYAVTRDGDTRHTQHVPDMVLSRDPVDGHPLSVAIEMELSHKAPSTLRQIMLSYRQAINIGHVYYYTPSTVVRNEVKAAATATGMADKVDVIKWEPSRLDGIALLT